MHASRRLSTPSALTPSSHLHPLALFHRLPAAPLQAPLQAPKEEVQGGGTRSTDIACPCQCHRTLHAPTSPHPPRQLGRHSTFGHSTRGRPSGTSLHALTPGSSAAVAQLEPQRDTGNAVFILMLVNVVLFLLDHVLHLPHITALYLHHAQPQWWQWLSHQFMHASWGHLSNNLFFLLTFGRLVEEGEGPWGVTMVYILCGLGAAVASFLLSPRHSVSLGASGAVFGLFVTSVLFRLARLNLRRLLESVVLGQFVVRQVLDEVKNQATGGLTMGGIQVSHLAHLGGALTGVLLICLLTRLPSGEPDK